MLPCVVLSYATLHYLTQCYIKLHFFTLHSLMSHVISVALLYPALHYIKLLYPMSTYAMLSSLHYNMLHSLTICWLTFPCLALPCVTLCYAPLRWAECFKLLIVNHFLYHKCSTPDWHLFLLHTLCFCFLGGCSKIATAAAMHWIKRKLHNRLSLCTHDIVFSHQGCKHLQVKHFLSHEMQPPTSMLIVPTCPWLLVCERLQQKQHTCCYGSNKQTIGLGYCCTPTTLFFLT